jgi:branched-chain amino acid transport system substrate-binding protein
LFDGAAVVAGYVNPLSAEKLEPLFAGANAVFLSLDAGYHFPKAIRKDAHVFYLSLQGVLCMRAAVANAIAAGHKDMAYTCSFYDAGYRSSFAVHSAVNHGGARITYNLVTPLKRADLKIEPLADHLATAPDDAVFTAFCGDMLQDFYAAAAAGHVLEGRAVYGSPFAGDEQWLPKTKYPGADVHVCVPWGTGLAGEANAHFMQVLKERKTNANIFSLLGWEAGLVAAYALGLADASAGLEGYAFDSPRGRVMLDADTHQCYAPVYDGVVVRGEATGNCRLVMGGLNAYAGEDHAVLQQDINALTGPMTSWQNTYGCLDS